MDVTLRRWWPIPLRILLGCAFIYHGLPKLFSAAGHRGFEGMLGHMHVPVPAFTAWLVAVVEVFGGLALLLGAVVTLATVLLVVEMVVAMFLVHWPHGFAVVNITGMTPQGPTFGMPGIEGNLLYIAGLLALLIGGAGPLSVDAAVRGRAPAGRGPLSAPSPREARA